MANNQTGQEALVTGWEMIPHPSFNQDSAQMNQEGASEGSEEQSIHAIEAIPISFFNPKTANCSSNKRRKAGTGSERLEILEKDFTLYEVFNLNNIEELNNGREKTLDHQEVLTNLKGWKIEKRMRIENNGNGRVDKIYRHPRSKKLLRSLKQVMNFIKENSKLRATDNGKGSTQDPNAKISSSYGEMFQHSNAENFSSGGNLLQDQSPCMNPESRFYLQVYASMVEGYKQQPQVLGSSRGYNPGTDRSRLAGMASSSSIHLQPQSQELSTQRQDGDMLQAQNRALVELVRALEEQNRVMKAQVDSFQTTSRSSGITIPPTLGSGSTDEKW